MRTAWIVVVVAVAACGADGGPGAAAWSSEITVEDRTGLGGSIKAWFFDRDVPGEPAPTDGNCVVDDDLVPSCDPDCPDGQICAVDGSCVDTPELVAAGTVTVTGTDAGDLMLTASAGSIVYGLQQEDFLLAGASRIEVSASGSEAVHAFDVGLDVPVGHLLPEGYGEASWPVFTAGTDLLLEWGTPDGASRVRVYLVDRVGEAAIWCDGVDAGSLTIPGETVSRFLAAASWTDGEALSTIERYRQTTAELADGRTIRMRLARGVVFAIPPP